jgi:predicted RecA/RadA family phage recombinase
MVGGQLVIPIATASSGTLTACHTRGVFRLPKVTGTAMVIGYWVMWDVSAGNVVYNKTAADDFNLGRVRKAAGSSDTYVEVIVDGRTRRVETVRCIIADVSTASDSALNAAPFAGRITQFTHQLASAITGADSVVTPKIGSTALTGGAVTVAYSGSAVGDIDISYPTAANVTAAGDILKAATDGASSTAAVGLAMFELQEL